MERVIGLGGVFFRSKDPARLRSWYREHLGVDVDEYGATLHWDTPQPDDRPYTAWSPFSADTSYFNEGQPMMVNFRVRDLDAMQAQLRAAGVEVLDKVEDSEFGRFGWCVDCEGHRVELWQPPAK